MTNTNYPIGIVLTEEDMRALERAAGAAGLSPVMFIETVLARALVETGHLEPAAS
ncbi:hypothetical protein [Rhodopseudomonas faecalis]|uniref:hypothetical protein n=1 Tax=Rhodopseudomonas faecalis TaxID=99655 RepID=UPI0015E8D334|nr:hypothetical protein [Rhodopseudomonas faecalis]